MHNRKRTGIYLKLSAGTLHKNPEKSCNRNALPSFMLKILNKSPNQKNQDKILKNK